MLKTLINCNELYILTQLVAIQSSRFCISSIKDEGCNNRSTFENQLHCFRKHCILKLIYRNRLLQVLDFYLRQHASKAVSILFRTYVM
jgi:hypothetical protein